MLGKLSVPGRPTNFANGRAGAYCACSGCGWGLFGHFFLSFIFSLFFFLPLFLPLLRGAVVEWLEQLGYGAESRRIA